MNSESKSSEIARSGMRLIRDKSGAGFDIFFNERLLFRHSLSKPCVEVGRGTGRFLFYYGLFKIRDLRRTRAACGDFNVAKEGPDRIVMEFSTGVSGKLTMTLAVSDNRLHAGFRIDGAGKQGGWNRLWLHWAAVKGEKVFGGGEQYSHLNLKGRNLPVWVQEPGLGRGFDLITLIAELKNHYGGRWFTTYFSQPTFVFTSGAFVHSASSAYTEGRFKNPDRHTLLVWEIPSQIVFGVENTPEDLMGSLTALLGRQPRLPSWTYDGMWLGAQGGREESRRKLTAVREAGVKVGGIWCQDWEGIRITSFGRQLMWNWSYDSGLYPDLPEYTGELKNEGIRFLGYINSFLALEGELYREAAQKGYCVKNKSGEDYLVTITTFPAAMLDLSHPGCREWIKGVIRNNMIGTGLSGWMADFGEYIPTDAVFHDGSDGLTYHNRYIAEWARINREAIDEAGRGDDIVFFMRAGYTGSTRYCPSFWNGDQLVNWSPHQGFPTVIPGSLSMGFTGVGYVHSDLGGYTTILWLKRSRELVLRWAEQAAFTQTMRSHEGNRPYVGVKLHEDAAILEQLARMTGVFAALKPYHEFLSDEYQEKGLPPIRHPWIHYPGDRQLLKDNLQYQYMYGADLMVAPVIGPGRKTRRLRLPDDRWIHLWTGKEYSGGSVRVPAPVGRPAVFYRKGSAWTSLFEELKTC